MTSHYEDSVLAVRNKEYEKAKSDPLHWLNLAGLFWLEEGKNAFGTAETNAVSHPAFPKEHCGYFLLKNKVVTFHPVEGLSYSSKYPKPESRPLITDRDKTPDLINVGSLAMKVIVRGEAILIRMWDREAQAKKDFNGFKYYPPDETYRVIAKYLRYKTPKPVKRLDLIGTETDGSFIGQAQFELQGSMHTLELEKDGKELLLHFTDGTSKDTTYGTGRRIYLPIPDGDEFVLDFNLAKNWPCAYTPFATCPVVPPENKMNIRIEAGEKKYFDD